MSAGDEDDGTVERRSSELAEGMLEEARQSATGGGEEAGEDPAASDEPEAGTVADTGEPAGTADAHAAGVMDTLDEDGP